MIKYYILDDKKKGPFKKYVTLSVCFQVCVKGA